MCILVFEFTKRISLNVFFNERRFVQDVMDHHQCKYSEVKFWIDQMGYILPMEYRKLPQEERDTIAKEFIESIKYAW